MLLQLARIREISHHSKHISCRALQHPPIYVMCGTVSFGIFFVNVKTLTFTKFYTKQLFWGTSTESEKKRPLGFRFSLSAKDSEVLTCV